MWGAWESVDWRVGRRVRDTDGTWRSVKRVLVRQKLQAMRVMYFLAVLGWVLLGIGCFVALCLLFGSWMSRTTISETCRDYGCDGGDSLLSVITG